MTTAQSPIHSGFGMRSTASEVLAGIDLSGKLAVVTGGYSGIGIEATRALAGAGADVIVPARRAQAAGLALGGIAGVRVAEMDLADLESVRRFAEGVVAEGRHVDMVIDSAGIMATPETRVGPGWEAQFATNHLGHFALINRLWPVLKGGARVVSVSSGGHGISDIRWDDLQFATGYDKWQAYGQAKTANVLFAVELDRLGQADGVRAFALHPGGIVTPLQRHMPREEQMALGWVDAEGKGINPDFKTPEQGASTMVWAATSPQLEGLGGVYCEDCDIAPIATVPGESGVRAYAVDGASARRLWAISAELTGVNAFAG
ncbi:MAG: SDR family NAD(P)-dependent oxidoreductase [Candidatus Devosia phytovorans]|uniref:Probable oxidoreductase n=1 Tax=Candidatus Devosia phytovorans TaxID=3121372 RepID=A0AAJ5VXG6_9HYPH|nr:SDR family NAD(P)-dependent oxidoreductase [Devosia sp.]WEK05267.1 MAG: SDR family NAD(P)-dependent oxidoreductase [Devosia sp.]